MAYEDEKLTEVENIGFIDCIVRGSASIAILVAVMLLPSITTITLFGLTQLAIYAGLTAFIGWDPLYALIKQDKARRPERVRAGVTSYPQREAPVSGGKHMKAA